MDKFLRTQYFMDKCLKVKRLRAKCISDKSFWDKCLRDKLKIRLIVPILKTKDLRAKDLVA